MIETFRDASLEAFYRDNVRDRTIPEAITNALARKLDVLEFATTSSDLRIPPGNRFENLEPPLDGWCSIRVNRQWRLIFRWLAPRAYDVYLDPHEYR
jgi:proteic killer suppression protein